MKAKTTQREGREWGWEDHPFPRLSLCLSIRNTFGKGGKGVTYPYSARARVTLIKYTTLQPKNPLPNLPTLPKVFFKGSKRGKGVIPQSSRPSRLAVVLAIFWFSAPIPTVACGGSPPPDPTPLPVRVLGI